MTKTTLDQKLRITFIGAGNMATALAGGMIAKGFPATHLCLTDINQEQLTKVNALLGVNTSTNNIEAIADAQVIVLAVKPQLMQTILKPLRKSLPSKTLVISIAAGITISQINEWLGENTAVVRCMPNTPALVNSGMTGLCANKNVTEKQHGIASALLDAAGETCWMKSEAELDAVTAVSGSGPAYFFLVAQAMVEAGQKMGLSEETAKQLTFQTAYGAAKMLLESDAPVATLRQRVTSPGGTTEAAVNVLLQEGIIEMFEHALLAAKNRSEELSKT